MSDPKPDRVTFDHDLGEGITYFERADKTRFIQSRAKINTVVCDVCQQALDNTADTIAAHVCNKWWLHDHERK